MHRLQWLGLILLLLATVAHAQTPSSDSQTLQILVEEVRQLRQELKTTTVTVERAQILIYRLQFQEATVARDLQRLDDARSKLAENQAARKEIMFLIKRLEDRRAGINNVAEQKETDDQLAKLKAQLDVDLISEEQQDKQR